MEEKKSEQDRNDFWGYLFKAFRMKSLAITSINPANKSESEIKKFGLEFNHAYSILDAFELVSDGKDKYKKLRRETDDCSNSNKKILK